MKRLDDGAVEAKDDHGFALKFQVTKRRELEMAGEKVNAPGSRPAARPQQDRRLGGHAGEAAHAFARRLLRARHSVGGGVLREAPRLQGHRPFQRRRPVSAARRHAGPSHALLHPDAGLHEGLRAFRLPHGRPDGADAGRVALHQGGLPVLLGARAAQVRLELVLVLQQPARLPCRIRRRHGPARRRMGPARNADEPRGRAGVPVRVPRAVGAGRSASRRERRRAIDDARLIGRMDDFGRARRAPSGRSTARASRPSSVRRTGCLYA